MKATTEHRSPFHEGEQKVQSRVGVRDRAETLGVRTIRTFMPEQHQDFYKALPYLFVGHVDDLGQPWASWLGDPQIDVEHERAFSLSLKAIHKRDPLHSSIQRKAPIAILGIDLSNRRRNRMSATSEGTGQGRLQLAVRQTFGNCPQYIQTREIEDAQKENHGEDTNDCAFFESPCESITRFSEEDEALIRASDTFFVSSYFDDSTDGEETGADVSHRGGQPGFVRVDSDSTLTIPDFSGNNHFNTLGNIQSNGKAGLLFADFDTGDLLMLTGTATILWDSEDTQFFEGAERLWSFKLTEGIRLKNALGLTLTFKQFSPNSLLAGSWGQATAAKKAEQQKQQWLTYTVKRTTDELGDVKSFELEPPKDIEPQFKAGQFVTVRHEIDGVPEVRTYTVSSAPSDQTIRISVKRDGRFSRSIHAHLHVGSTIEARAPAGDFYLNPKKPAVFVAGGIGVTPMISMIREGFFRSIKYREPQQMVLFYQMRDEGQFTFQDELRELEDLMEGELRVVKLFSSELATDSADADYKGHLNREILSAELPLKDYEFYLCGPAGFAQNAYDEIRALGVDNACINAEAFGPASLTRDVTSHTVLKIESANNAVVEFVPSNVVQGWTPEDGNLLEFAEAHGLEPNSGCRAGHCGSCTTKVLSGDVVYDQPITYPVEEGEVLLCCAVPSKTSESEPLKLDL